MPATGKDPENSQVTLAQAHEIMSSRRGFRLRFGINHQARAPIRIQLGRAVRLTNQVVVIVIATKQMLFSDRRSVIEAEAHERAQCVAASRKQILGAKPSVGCTSPTNSGATHMRSGFARAPVTA